MSYNTKFTHNDIEYWLDNNNQLFEVSITPEFIKEMSDTCINLKNLLTKANKRINAISLYFSWQGMIKGDPLFTEQKSLGGYNYDLHVKRLLEEQQPRHDIILFILSSSFLNISIKNQGKIITIFTDDVKQANDDSYIDLNTVEWSAELQLKLSRNADIKPTEFNNIVISFRHLVLKAQLILNIPRLDELFKMRTFNQTAICKMLDIQPYQLTKLIDISVQLGYYTEGQIQGFLVPGNSSRQSHINAEGSTQTIVDANKDDNHRYQLSSRNERFVQNVADEFYRGNTFQALNKLLTTTQTLIERGLIEGKLKEGDGDSAEVTWDKTNQSILTGLDRTNKEV